MELPKVTCVSVIRDNKHHIDLAINSYKQQTYENKELLLITNFQLNQAIEESNIKTLYAPRYSVGEAKNLALEKSSGQIIINWQQGGLSSPERISSQLLAMAHSDADIVLLSEIGLRYKDADYTVSCPSLAMVETIAYIRHPDLLYPKTNLGTDLYLLELAYSKGLSAISIPGIELYSQHPN